jgi:hypothetical protein
VILPDVINPRLDNRTNTQLPLAAAAALREQRDSVAAHVLKYPARVLN